MTNPRGFFQSDSPESNDELKKSEKSNPEKPNKKRRGKHRRSRQSIGGSRHFEAIFSQHVREKSSPKTDSKQEESRRFQKPFEPTATYATVEDFYAGVLTHLVSIVSERRKEIQKNTPSKLEKDLHSTVMQSLGPNMTDEQIEACQQSSLPIIKLPTIQYRKKFLDTLLAKLDEGRKEESFDQELYDELLHERDAYESLKLKDLFKFVVGEYNKAREKLVRSSRPEKFAEQARMARRTSLIQDVRYLDELKSEEASYVAELLTIYRDHCSSSDEEKTNALISFVDKAKNSGLRNCQLLVREVALNHKEIQVPLIFRHDTLANLFTHIVRLFAESSQQNFQVNQANKDSSKPSKSSKKKCLIM